MITVDERLFVGVGWGNEHHQLCAVDGSGRLVGQQRVSHDRDGLAVMDAVLGGWGPVAGIAIERGEWTCWSSISRPRATGCSVCHRRCPPRARERYRLAPSKSDAFDAYVLADSLRHEHGRWRSLAVPSPLLAELRALTRDRERLIWNQRDVENRLRAIVAVYHPAVLHLFSSLDRDITLAFLRDYSTPAHAARVGVSRMGGFCHRHG